MTNWYDDPLFSAQDRQSCQNVFRLDEFAAPAFRLTLQSHWQQGHPFEYRAQYEKLFSVFEPYLRRDADRLVMIETAGRHPRRRTRIRDEDWEPFRALQDAVLAGAMPRDEITEWRFIGFDYQPSPQAEQRSGVASTKFFLHVEDAINLDVTIPLDDFHAPDFDLEGLKDALLALPVSTAIAGYGLGFTDSFGSLGAGSWLLEPIAKRYPVLDLYRPADRTWRGGDADDLPEHWLLGINWLTLVGEPFLSRLGGIEAVTDGLDPRITWRAGDGVVLFQLGARPVTGQHDVDDELLPLYVELGARLNYSTMNGRTGSMTGAGSRGTPDA